MAIRPIILRAAWAAIAVVLAGCATTDQKQPSSGAGAPSAATVTVTPSVSGPVPVGTSFYVAVSGANMPKTDGATLGLKWNEAVVEATGVELAPRSPFDFLGIPSVKRFTFARTEGNVCERGPCSFDAIRVTFTALAAGNADITFIEDGRDKCWGDPDTEHCFARQPAYRQAEVTVVLPPPGQAK